MPARSGILVQRGQWSRGEEILAAAQRLSSQAAIPEEAVIAQWKAFLFADLRGRPLPSVFAGAAGQAGFLQGFFTHYEGDSSRVRAEARRFAAEFSPELRTELLAGVEGFLAFREQRWGEAIRGLSPPARGSHSGGWIYDRLRNRARWAVATAFERTGQPDSAALYLGFILQPAQWSDATILERPLYEPFVRGRLIRLALARGRADEARAHWDELQRAMTLPDEEARRYLDDSRDALAMAGGMEARERR